jgi:hypothetical protein
VLAALLVVGWFLPQVIVLTDLRDRPLQMALAGIDGRVTSRSATWTWLRGIEYRNIVLSDRTGRPVLVVKRAVSDHGLVGLALDPTHLGTVRLIGGEALVEIRRGGSNLEDILAPFLAAAVQSAAVPMSFELEVVDGAIELVDLERRDAWRITDVIAAGAVRPDAALAGWTISGRVLHAGEPVRDLTAAVTRPPPPAPWAPTAPRRAGRPLPAQGSACRATPAHRWGSRWPPAPQPAPRACSARPPG